MGKMIVYLVCKMYDTGNSPYGILTDKDEAVKAAKSLDNAVVSEVEVGRLYTKGFAYARHWHFPKFD